MSDLDVVHPDWEQLFQAAMLELDPIKLLDRIVSARNAILDRIEDRHSRLAKDE